MFKNLGHGLNDKINAISLGLDLFTKEKKLGLNIKTLSKSLNLVYETIKKTRLGSLVSNSTFDRG